MILTISLLIISTFIGGLGVRLIPEQRRNVQLPLMFAGSYLLAITTIHIIPELFAVSPTPKLMGLYILLGFFLQQFFEYFSAGVEHGHVHERYEVSFSGRISIIVALMVHSFLEGTLLIHDSPVYENHKSHSLLLGIILHKVPAAFALMVAMQPLGKKAYYLFALFSIASPLGLLFSELILFSEQILLIIFAVVGGSFLHIATTIFVEVNSEHRYGLKKTLIGVLGALLAVIVEFLN